MMRDATLVSRWPRHLVEQVSAGNFVLVVGAGVSRSAKNSAGVQPPDWMGLLSHLMKVVAPHGGSKVRKMATSTLESGDLLECAELLKFEASRVGKLADFDREISSQTTSPSDGYLPSTLHQALMRLSPKTVITTNYDKLLESVSENTFKVHSFTSTSVAHEVRMGEPVLIKIHGSVDDSSNLILTRSDFAKVRKSGRHALDVVQSLFMTRPALFVGYSFNDPDIHLLLENVVGREERTSHYLLTDSSIPNYREQMYGQVYGTAVIKFAKNNFDEMERMIDLLAATASTG